MAADAAAAAPPAGAVSRVFRYSSWDALFVGGAMAHGALLCGAGLLVASAGPVWLALAIPLAALSICWLANTVAHNQIHNPVFRAPWANRMWELALTALSGIPQTIWRRRHLWHHAGEPPRQGRRRGLGRRGWAEVLLVVALWAALALLWPRGALLFALPSYALGLLLCQLQGHLEHYGEGQEPRPRGGGVSCYARWYNWLWFNDGYHVEHHCFPRRHWREHPRSPRLASREDRTGSALPPLLRWGEPLVAGLNRAQGRALVALERLALASRPLSRWMVRSHRRAAAALLQEESSLGDRDGPEHVDVSSERVVIIGGGLFPRTLLALAPLFPEARFLLVDGSETNLETAQAYLQRHAPELLFRLELQRRLVDLPALIELAEDAQRVVVPLGFVGDRWALYEAGAELSARLWIHDWLWSRRGATSARISLWLLKRLSAAR